MYYRTKKEVRLNLFGGVYRNKACQPYLLCVWPLIARLD